MRHKSFHILGCNLLSTCLVKMEMALSTETIKLASSIGISIPILSSIEITKSTASRESKPRSLKVDV